MMRVMPACIERPAAGAALSLGAALAWLVALLLLACGAARAAGLQARFDFDATPGLLSKQVVPVRYALELDVDPARDAFSGTVRIALRVRTPVPAIVLHAHGLQAESARLGGADNARARVLDVRPDDATQTWRLVPADGAPIAAGEHRLEIAYRGTVRSTGQGLYRASYEWQGRTERMLATQLASIHARNLLPSFDEPAFRAEFELTVRAPAGLEVLSNMPLAERRADGADAQVHRFAPTPPMPSYLFALAAGRFDALADQVAGIPVRILTAPERREQARYAMDVTRQVLPYFGEYFGIPFALPKLDQLAVPGTRDGAMEDWGLVSYAEYALLYDPLRSPAHRRPTVYETVAHEISHQWFGNLVTHAWWDDIWLNEAFATWIAAKVTERFNPKWPFRLERRLSAEDVMTRDSGPSTRAIRAGPVSEKAVYDTLDEVTYYKGGVVLAMLEQWIGEEPFRRGLGAYLRERSHSNATAGDLWHHVSQASGRDVAAVAASWTDQPGLPLVGVRTRCEGGRTTVQLEQRRFVTTPRLPAEGVWQVPVVFLHGGKESTVLLDKPQAEFELSGCAPLVVNAGGRGYYRVDYEGAQRRDATRRFGALAPADKITLLSDRFALVQAGLAPAAEYFELLAALPRVRDESRPTLYMMAIEALRFLDDAFAGTPAQEGLRAAGRALLAPELARIGWSEQPGEPAYAPRVRSELVVQLARFDDRQVAERALKMFDADASGSAPLEGSLRSAVVHAAGMQADERRHARLLARLKAATGEDDRWLYARALASGPDPARAKELLQVALDGSVPPNIASSLPRLVARWSPHGDVAYDFTLAHWDQLARLAGQHFSADAWLLPGAAWRFNERERAQRLRDDQRRKADAAAAAPAEQGAARIELLADVREREAAAMERALAGWKPQDPRDGSSRRSTGQAGGSRSAGATSGDAARGR
jgi:aminopeptidase N